MSIARPHFGIYVIVRVTVLRPPRSRSRFSILIVLAALLAVYPCTTYVTYSRRLVSRFWTNICIGELMQAQRRLVTVPLGT